MSNKELVFLLDSGCSIQDVSTKDNVVTFSQDISTKINNCRHYQNFVNERVQWRDCIFESIDVFESLREIKLNGQLVFSDALAYEGMSLLDAESNRLLSGHNEYIARLIKKIKQIKNIIEKSEPTKIIICGGSVVEQSIITRICEFNDILCDNKNNFNNPSVFNRYEFTDQSEGTFLKSKKDLGMIPTSVSFSTYSYLIMARCLIRKFKLNNSTPTGDYDVIIYLHGLKWLQSMDPVIKKLSDKYKTLIIVRENEYESLKDYDHTADLKNIRAYYTQCTEQTVLKTYRKALKYYSESVDTQKVSKQVKICGLSFERMLDHWIKDIIVHSHNSLRYYLLMNEILKVHSPDCLIMPHDSQSFVKAFAEVCSNYSVPVVNIRTGAPNLTSECYLYNGDKLLVPGRSTKEIFTSMGISSDKIVITGLPRFRGLLNLIGNNNKVKNEVKEKFGINDSKKIVTYITQTMSGRFNKAAKRREINTVYQSISKIDDAFLIVKTHPSEKNTNIYKNIAKKADIDDIAIASSDLNRILVASNISLTKNSTAGFNAILAGNELIILNLTNRDTTVEPFARANIFEEIKQPKALIDCINNKISLIKGNTKHNTLFNSDRLSEFISYHFKHIGENPEQNIISEIDQLINSNNS